MSSTTTTISCVKLEPAENGVILTWDERIEKQSSSKNTYDGFTRYETKRKVYDGEEGAADKMDSAFDAAQPEFKRLWKLQASSGGRNY